MEHISRDGRAIKSHSNKGIAGIITDERHPYTRVPFCPHACTGREWSASTTTQPFLPPLGLVIPPLTRVYKVLKCYI